MPGGTQCKQVQLITVVLIGVGMASLSMCMCGVFIVVAIVKSKLTFFIAVVSMAFFSINLQQQNLATVKLLQK